MLQRIALKIRRREGPVYSRLYRAARWVLRFDVPPIPLLSRGLYGLHWTVFHSVSYLASKLWSEPLFRTRCAKVGRGLSLPNGMPYIIGHPRLELGDYVSLNRTTIGSTKLFDEPVFRVGSRTTVGYGTVVSVAKEVSIGDDCLIGPGCYIMDSDDHPLEPEARRRREPVSPGQVKPVNIGNNVWVGARCFVLRGVTIGDNTVVSACSIVTRSLPANCVAAGNPARPVIQDIAAYAKIAEAGEPA